MVGDRSMLRATIDRTVGLADLVDPLVVCNAAHHHLAATELSQAGHDRTRVILEPVGRNTAPAVAAAALLVANEAADPLMLVLPADHVITDEDAFRSAVAVGVPHAVGGALVTFGIVPTRPETGYGYIRTGEPVESGNRIDRFVEKPDAATAALYVDDGGYLWNSGMFLFSAASYLSELAAHAPDILSAVEAAVSDAATDEGVGLATEAFAGSPSVSIDYAVMEHTEEGVVIPLDAGWNDVGSWTALHDVSPHDEAGNTVVGDVTLLDTSDSYVRSSGRLVTAIGLDQMVVVDTPDALIVAPLARSQDVKTLVDNLKDRDRPEASTAATGVEPWGTWRRLDTLHANAMEVVIEPGATAELARRREIIVVRGPVGTVAVEARSSLDSGDVAVLTHPRITNHGSEAAVLIVVEIGGDP
jgi:mannose-1-phosphate guanylyltransferase/mannose-6-phosphate isomerase